ELRGEGSVRAGGDPAPIRVAYGGNATRLSLDDAGALHVTAGAAELVEAPPEVYQEVDGRRVEVAARYVLEETKDQGPRTKGDGDGSAGSGPSSFVLCPSSFVGFAIGAYDPAPLLV